MGKEKIQEKEFTQLISQSQGIIHKVCRMYCDDEEHRQDLFQEILLQLWKSYPSFKGKSKFSSWMYRVALNVAIQDFRKEKRRKLLFFDSYEFKNTAAIWQNSFENEQLKELYFQISKLDKIEKAIVLLHLDEVANEEIAEIVGISQNYVRVKMSRIKKKLAENIKNN